MTAASIPPKPCPPGKERNPATNRCRNIKPSTKSKPKSKPKPSTKSKPKTKPSTKSKPKTKPSTKSKPKPKTLMKPCPPGKERNPATNRCRKLPTTHTVSAPTSGKVIAVDDVLHNLVTINGHGTFNPKKIKVPKGFQVLIPHRRGLEADYTTPDAGKNILYEEGLYGDGYLNYRGGWRLYIPGDEINDLIISPFVDGAKCTQIEGHKLQVPLIKACRKGQVKIYQDSCPLYCTRPTEGTFKYLDYGGFHKLKIKACGKYHLSHLFKSLPKQLKGIPSDIRSKISPGPTEPIVIVPFTCNSKLGSSMNAFDRMNHASLHNIYHKLIQKRL